MTSINMLHSYTKIVCIVPFLFLLSCAFAEAAPPVSSSTSRFVGVITEVEPNDTDNDWVEFFVTGESGTIAGCTLWEGNTLVKTFPNALVHTGDYIVLYVNSNFSDETTDKGANGYWDWHSTDTYITNTDTILMIKDKKGTIIDCVCYANNDATWSTTNQSLFDVARASGAWIASENEEAQCAAWDGTTGYSLTRKADSTMQPMDTHTKDDWTIACPTKGYGYGSSLPASVDAVHGDVVPKQFSPYNAAAPYTTIMYTTPQPSTVRVYVYDVQGRCVRFLKEDTAQKSDVQWDGKDENGNIVPVGIYIVLWEATDVQTGRTTTARKPVVVGQRL